MRMRKEAELEPEELRLAETCFFCILLHETKSAKRIKLVSLNPKPNRCQTALLPEAFSHVQRRQWLSSGAENSQPGLHYHWADLAEGQLHSCTEEHYLCITPHLPAAIPFGLLPFLPSYAFISPSFLPSLHLSLPPWNRETRDHHSWQEKSLLLHSPRGPATPPPTNQ